MYGSKKVSEIEYIPVLVTFFCPHAKIFCKSNLGKEGFTLAHSSKAQSIVVEKLWQQEFGPIASKVRKQRAMMNADT